ncbi:MAG TPA: hypothetical protein VMW86_01215 [Dehalococcoidales bacterium]|nr:hypothetical protein [Dehalococcoidales bacterium]
MAIRLYFEKLSPGLHAKLDAKYRTNNKSNHRYNVAGIRARLERGGFGINEPVDIVQVSCGRTRQ